MQEHFLKTKPKKTDQQIREQKEQLLATVSEDAREKLTDEVLAAACSLGMVVPAFFADVRLASESRSSQSGTKVLWCGDLKGLRI
jgi:hypothetical protein